MICGSYFFISYSHVDRTQVSILASHLLGSAKGVFMDERTINIPSLWRQFVDSHLLQSDVVLVCYSRRMLERSRGWVHTEHRLIEELESRRPVRVVGVCIDGSATAPPHPFSDRTIVNWDVTDSSELTMSKIEAGLLSSGERHPDRGLKVVSEHGPKQGRPALGDRIRRLLPTWLHKRQAATGFNLVFCDDVSLDFFGEETGTVILKVPKGATTAQVREQLLDEYPCATLRSDEARVSMIYDRLGALIDPSDPGAARSDRMNQIVLHFGEAGSPRVFESIAERVLSVLSTGLQAQLGVACKVEPPSPNLVSLGVAEVLIVQVLPLPTWDPSWADGLAADAHSRIAIVGQETLGQSIGRVLSVVIGASLDPALTLGCEVRLFGCDQPSS